MQGWGGERVLFVERGSWGAPWPPAASFSPGWVGHRLGARQTAPRGLNVETAFVGAQSRPVSAKEGCREAARPE